MANKFSVSSLKSTEINSYTLDSFNGVDYTDMPSKVDQSRAVDMSNYLPTGNSLRKRNGWQLVNKTYSSDSSNFSIEQVVEFKGKYIVVYKTIKETTHSLHFYWYDSLNQIDNDPDGNENSWHLKTYSINDASNTKCEFINYEDRLFVIGNGNYSMIRLDDEIDELIMSEVSDDAYIPTFLIGVEPALANKMEDNIDEYNPKTTTASVSSILEPKNLISNTFKVKINTHWEQWKKEFESGNIRARIIYHFNSDVLGGSLNFVTIDGEKRPLNAFVTGNSNDSFVAIIKRSNAILKIESIELRINLNPEDYDDMALKFGDSIELWCTKYYDSQNRDMGTVVNMTKSQIYGSEGYKDRLFLTGNKDYPNLDIHSAEASFGERWQDFSYFPDDNYQTFGANNSAIIGYGFMNNGYMAIFKESDGEQPNLYFRHGEIYQEQNEYETIYKEKFPIVLSGININLTKESQIINYGNSLLLNAPQGIYKVNLTPSTATQTYEVNEVSYYIRNELSNDLSGSSYFINEGMLYITRKDKYGKLRTYVCDEHRYSYVNEKMQYEWWVMDGLDPKQLYNFNGEIYFVNDKGLCKFMDGYADKYNYRFKNVTIGGLHASDFNIVSLINDRFYIPETNEIIDGLKTRKDYDNLLNNTTITCDRLIMQLSIGVINMTSTSLTFAVDRGLVDYLNDAAINQLSGVVLYYQNKAYEMVDLEQQSVNEEYNIQNVCVSVIPINDYPNLNKNDNWVRLVFDNYEFKIHDLYTLSGESYTEYVNDGSGEFESKVFNSIGLDIQGYELQNLSDNSSISNVIIKYSVPVNAYWCGKHESMGKLDYLKSATGITFTTGPSEATATTVGYRVSNREIIYDVTNVNRKYSLDFNDIDFNYFSFGVIPFTNTFTSKKKIKNFAFIQLFFKSDKPINSTIGAVTINYKYSKKSRGVK